MSHKILFILGTRPEAIKLAPLIKKAKADDRYEVSVCSTGQHREMLKPIFKIFDFHPDHDFDLMKPGQALVDITAAILSNLRRLIVQNRPDWIVVQGDTTTVLASSLCAFYEKIPVAHVEAGLRTGDMHSPFPEEFNRCATSLMAKLHFAPTPASAANLYREGISREKVLVTGNTGIDALLDFEGRLQGPEVLAEFTSRFHFLDLRKKLILVTVHRRENFGTPLKNILRALLQLSHRDDIEFIVPLHLNPEVRREAEATLGSQAQWVEKNSKIGQTNIWLCEPQDYANFIFLMSSSHFIITDSGGVQEEAPSLGKPVLVVRESTERPEAVAAGTSKLVGSNQTRIELEATALLDDDSAYLAMARAYNPFGDGKASQRILDRIHAESSQTGELPLDRIAGIAATPDYSMTPIKDVVWPQNLG